MYPDLNSTLALQTQTLVTPVSPPFWHVTLCPFKSTFLVWFSNIWELSHSSDFPVRNEISPNLSVSKLFHILDLLFFPHKMRSRAQMKQIAKFVPFLIFYLLFWEGILAFFMLSKKVSMHCHHIDKVTVKTVIISRFSPHPDTS